MTLSGEAVALFLLQVTVVVGIASFLRTLATRYNQPGILAELAAGIILGPTILGKLSPTAFNFLFGGEASRFLEIVALIGLILFMFVAGAEVSWQGAFQRKNLFVGLGGLVAPLAAGMLRGLNQSRDRKYCTFTARIIIIANTHCWQKGVY